MDTNHGAIVRRSLALAKCAAIRKATQKSLRNAYFAAGAMLLATIGAAVLMRPSMFAYSLGMCMLSVVTAVFIFMALDFQRDEDELRREEGLPRRETRDEDSETLLESVKNTDPTRPTGAQIS